MCGYVHMSLVGVHRVQKRPSESLEPEFQVLWAALTWVLKAEFGFCEETVNVLNC